MFGYLKSSLLGRNIRALMPDFLAKHHHKALLEAEKKDVSYFTKRKNVFSYGKEVSGYIFPLYINIKKVLSFSSQGDQYVGLLYPALVQGKVREMHMLIDRKLDIVEISEECYGIARLRKDVIKRQKVSIKLLLPAFPESEELGSIAGDSNVMMAFLEKEMELTVPDITETAQRSDNNSSYGSAHKSMGSDNGDESVYTKLRKNEGENDSFVFHEQSLSTAERLVQDDSGERESDSQENIYTITPSDTRIRCRVGIAQISLYGELGFAVRVVQIPLIFTGTPRRGSVLLHVRSGKYKIEYNEELNCHIRDRATNAREAVKNLVFVFNWSNV